MNVAGRGLLLRDLVALRGVRPWLVVQVVALLVLLVSFGVFLGDWGTPRGAYVAAIVVGLLGVPASDAQRVGQPFAVVTRLETVLPIPVRRHLLQNAALLWLLRVWPLVVFAVVLHFAVRPSLGAVLAASGFALVHAAERLAFLALAGARRTAPALPSIALLSVSLVASLAAVVAPSVQFVAAAALATVVAGAAWAAQDVRVLYGPETARRAAPARGVDVDARSAPLWRTVVRACPAVWPVALQGLLFGLALAVFELPVVLLFLAFGATGGVMFVASAQIDTRLGALPVSRGRLHAPLHALALVGWVLGIVIGGWLPAFDNDGAGVDLGTERRRVDGERVERARVVVPSQFERYRWEGLRLVADRGERVIPPGADKAEIARRLAAAVAEVHGVEVEPSRIEALLRQGGDHVRAIGGEPLWVQLGLASARSPRPGWMAVGLLVWFLSSLYAARGRRVRWRELPGSLAEGWPLVVLFVSCALLMVSSLVVEGRDHRAGGGAAQVEQLLPANAGAAWGLLGALAVAGFWVVLRAQDRAGPVELDTDLRRRVAGGLRGALGRA